MRYLYFSEQQEEEGKLKTIHLIECILPLEDNPKTRIAKNCRFTSLIQIFNQNKTTLCSLSFALRSSKKGLWRKMIDKKEKAY